MPFNIFWGSCNHIYQIANLQKPLVNFFQVTVRSRFSPLLLSQGERFYPGQQLQLPGGLPHQTRRSEKTLRS